MFLVISTSAVPVGLRGELTRWLLEVSPGTFVGNLSARVRDAIWDLCIEEAGNGSVLLVHAANNEQGLSFRTHGTHWTPVDRDGLTLILRPEKPISASTRADSSPQYSTGRPDSKNSGAKRDTSSWSIAARRRRFRKPIEQRDARLRDPAGNTVESPERMPDPPF